MPSCSDTVHFHFPTHGNSILSKINALRETHSFCDIILLLGVSQGPAVQPLRFHGHRVVLAASSDFLRDQFLLHEGRAELSVGVISNMEVGKRLLLSCYTGLLEVPLRELVNYLTAASALQMSQVVEKCAQAVSQYLSPTLAFLKMERHSEEKIVQQSDTLKNQEEKDAAQPSTTIHEACSDEGGADVIQTKSRVSQKATLDSQGLKEVRDDRVLVIAKLELPEDAGSYLKSDEVREIQPINSLTTLGGDYHIKANPRHKLLLHTAFRDHISPTRPSSSQHEELVDSFHNQDEEAGEEQRDKEGTPLLQGCGELIDSNLICFSGEHLSRSHCPGAELTEDSDNISVHRPYLCRRCNRVFQHQESYVGHLKQHRRYLCLVCGKGFSQKRILMHHIRIHTAVKPFRCPLCQKTFSQTATLRDHLNLHTWDKPHKCNYCAVSFAYKPVLRRHLKDIHGRSSL